MAFQRGDGVIFARDDSHPSIKGKRYEIVVGKVTSITKAGRIKEFDPLRHGISIPLSQLGLSSAKAYRLPQQDWDVEAVLEYCACRPWPTDPRYKGKQFDDIEQARAELNQFRIARTPR